MQDYKTIVGLITVGHYSRQPGPMLRVHIAGVDRIRKRIRVYYYIQGTEFVKIVHQMAEIKRFQCACHRITAHADCATCVYEQHPTHFTSHSTMLTDIIMGCPFHGAKLSIFNESLTPKRQVFHVNHPDIPIFLEYCSTVTASTCEEGCKYVRGRMQVLARKVAMLCVREG